MPVVEALWWYLTRTPLIFGKWGGVILQEPETVPQVLVFKMVPKAVPGPRGPWASGKGAKALQCALWKIDVKYFWKMFRLTDRQPVTLNFRLCTMYSSYMCRH